MIAWVSQFLYSQFIIRIPYPSSDFSGQTIIITGSNTGLGLEAARHVARLGADKVILAVRTISKGETAADDIAKSCDIPRSRIEVWQLDMSSTDSIKRFAERAKSLKRLDGAILNAGVMTQERWDVFGGNESHIAINVVGSVLLASLLLPTMQASASKTGLRGRIGIVGSDMMYLADRSQLDTPESILERLKDKAYTSQLSSRYELSKILLYWNVHELAERAPLDKTNVIVDVLTPGACKSDLFRDGMSFGLTVAWNTIARTTEVGARTLVYGVAPDLAAAAHGGFLMDNKVRNPNLVLGSDRDRALAQKWNTELFSYLESIVPGSTKV